MTNLLIIYINNLIIFLLFRFTLIINEDKSSGDTTLTYKRGGGSFFLSPICSKCLHPKRVYESNGSPESLDKISFRSAKIISSMYTYKPAIKVAIHTCIIMHNPVGFPDTKDGRSLNKSRQCTLMMPPNLK